MPKKGWKYLTDLFCFGLILISCRGVLFQDCTEPNVPNSIFAGQTAEGGNAGIICNVGYEGGGTIMCTAGNWDILPPCTPKACPDQAVANGDLTGELYYEGSATVICDPGYEGGGAAECGPSNAWVTVPTCTPVDCGQPVIDNGRLEAGSQTAYNELATVECDNGYEGGGTATCLATTEWDTLPTCTPVDCGPPDITNGNFNGDTFYTGSATVTCDAGYDGSGVAFCSTDAAWDILPDCTAKDCGTPNTPNGGLTADSTTVFNGIAVVECHEGYEGGGAATCLSNAAWDTLPLCTFVDCGTPNIPYGSLTDESTTVFDGTAIVECHDGYEGGGVAICLYDATWDRLPPCTPVDCGIPVIDNGRLEAGSQTVYNELATVECDNGYEGGGTATCLATGSWDTDTLPACSPVDCGTPNITNGNFNGDTFHTGSAIVICDIGYDGSGVAFCSTGATWDILPDCTAKDCGPLTVQNGVFSGDTVYAGDTSVTCNAGYDFSGVLECGCDGTWATPSPTCSPKDCGDPREGNPDLIHSELLVGDTFFNDGTSVFFSCHTGYEAGGTATCLDTGDWGPLPTCNPKDCGTPNTPNGGLTADSTTVFNGTAVVECHEGYEGGGTATCLSNAAWDTLPPCTFVANTLQCYVCRNCGDLKNAKGVVMSPCTGSCLQITTGTQVDRSCSQKEEASNCTTVDSVESCYCNEDLCNDGCGTQNGASQQGGFKYLTVAVLLTLFMC